MNFIVKERETPYKNKTVDLHHIGTDSVLFNMDYDQVMKEINDKIKPKRESKYFV